MKININNTSFTISAVKSSQFPQDNLPEVVFVGKSNVGKSSILNALLNRKKLAYVGSTPGKTQQINFFNIDNKLYFVDLPGYSFSIMGKEKAQKINKSIDLYLKSRKNIALVIMLVDIRHNPSSDDKIMYDYLINSDLNFVIVPTKADKLPITKIPDYCKNIQSELNCPEEIDIIPVSSTKKENLDAIWQAILQIFPED